MEKQKKAEQLTDLDPSYVMVAFLAHTQYERLIKIEDDIYTKVSILIAFMSALLITVVNDMQWKVMFKNWDFSSFTAFVDTGLYQILSLLSLLGMLITTFLALKISVTKREKELDAKAYSSNRILSLPSNEVAKEVIQDLTNVIENFKAELNKKQKIYNNCIRILTISTLLYVLKVIIENVF